MRQIILTIVFHLFLISTSLFAREEIASVYTKGGGFEADKIITYKKADSTSLNLYIFYPEDFEEGEKRPAIAFYFGGGWQGGHVSQFYAQSEYLTSRGMVAICVQYRIGRHGYKPWQCVEDAKSAIRYIRKHANQLGVDPNKLAAAGGSAGGHLAAATATIKAFDCKNDDLLFSSVPNALVLFNPVYDNGPNGYGYERVKNYYKKFSPMHNVKGKLPPTLVLIGDKDKHTSVETTMLYEQKMKDEGNLCKTIIYKDQKHGFFNMHKSKDATYFIETTKDMDVFLASLNYLKGDPTITEWFQNQIDENEHIILNNQFINLQFNKTESNILLSKVSRTNGKDKLVFNNMGFEIILLNSKRYTINNYRFTGYNKSISNETQMLKLNYALKSNVDAPKKLSIIYELGNDAHFRKQIMIESDSTGFIDRLQTMRFTTNQNVAGGGHGQPLYIGKWFLGMDYPGFYSWHSNNFQAPIFNLRNPYDIDLDGMNKEFEEKDGLATLYHFPGYAIKNTNGKYTINSKKAVMGISKNPSHNAELALLNYIEDTRLKPKSFLHFNNWYSIDAKKITIENFVNNTYLPIKKNFDKFDVKLDAMVPDHGWQDGKFATVPYRVYAQKNDGKQDKLHEISKALQENGTKLGIWLSFDGRNQSIEDGVKKGDYINAISDNFDKNKYKWTSSKPFFNILQPKYQKDIKESIKYLIEEAEINYFKHDFNHLFTSNYITERHAREKCLDVTLELMNYERQLNPDVFLNYTNGSWFSPFWLQHVHTLWMMSGDSGGNGDYPQLSLREGATTYRDKYFYDNFRLERTDRPVIPIANFMTHGILFSKRKPFTNFNDIIDDWSNYVVMYYGRGTTVKELYITHDLLSNQDWEVLGKATKWAVENQRHLLNSVYIGGDASKPEPYGYISWNGNKAILTVRNSQRESQKLTVPFNSKVYFRGEDGETYRAKCIYPYIEEKPWKLMSGEEFEITIPGDCVMVYEIEEGEAKSNVEVNTPQLPDTEVITNRDLFNTKFKVPAEKSRRFDFILESQAVINPFIKINGKSIPASRENKGKRWSLNSWDLCNYSGKVVIIEGLISDFDIPDGNKPFMMKAYLLADQKAKEKSINIDDKFIPLSIMRGYRRASKLLFELEIEGH
jgi:acetyl esterase/lipase